MKTVMACVLIAQLIITGFALWLAWDSAVSLHQAASALEKASNDYRDDYRNYQAERLRIGQALSQLERDMVRMRSYLQKKGG